MKRFLGFFLAAVMLLSLTTTAFAAVEGTGFSDVAADAWYADAVEYARDNGLMSGTSATTFSPNDTMTRAMLAMVLYRLAGSPVVSGQDSFTDTIEGSWYSGAILWSSQRGVISGYGSGLFGTNDPITREQIATILWRYDGSPKSENSNDFADESAIASYAMDAVDWIRSNGIMNGKGGNMFDPKGNATRAEVATILRNYVQLAQDIPSEPDPEPTEGGKILVAYFSATNTTEGVAGIIADTLNADLFELEPADPYTSADLNYGNGDSRVVYEHEHPEAQDIELVAETVDNWDEYDVVFIGYPIWWHAAAWPVNRFVTGNDFTGKTVIPFCTSASSGLGNSGELLEEMAGTGNWLEGRNFYGRESDAVIADWVNSLGL